MNDLEKIDIQITEYDLELLKDVVYNDNEVTWTFNTNDRNFSIDLVFKRQEDDRD